MKLKSASGLTLVELVVVIAVLLLFAAGLPMGNPSNAVMSANMTAVGMRGRDIFVAIEGANTERKALGLPSVWPRDSAPAVDTNAEELARLDFDNSTGYFRWLHDEARWSTTTGGTRAEGFDYTKLAGAGVSACPDSQKLTATNNMWTIAKNVRDDMDDVVPVLITRNIDASSLAARIGERDLKEKTLRFDPSWKTPFSDKGFVLIRKGGAIFKARAKYMGYKVVYQNKTFDTALTTNGTALPPLKYLTPTREVTPGVQAYAEGADIAYRLAGGWWGILWNEACQVVAGVWLFALFLAFLFLSFFAYYTTRRKTRGLNPRPAVPVMGGWFCHYLSVLFYVNAACETGRGRFWPCLLVAACAQVVGIALAFALPKQDRAARWRQVLWVLLVPLQLGALYAILSLCCR